MSSPVHIREILPAVLEEIAIKALCVHESRPKIRAEEEIRIGTTSGRK